jgi:hypothetical protein
VSDQNVERFTECAEAFNRLAAEGSSYEEVAQVVPAMLATMDPEIQFEPQQAALQGSHTGHEGVTAWLLDLVEVYEGGSIDYDEIRAVGDQVLGLGSLRVIGRGSGIETEVPIAIVATFRDGLMTDFKDYGDKTQAMEAVGLS